MFSSHQPHAYGPAPKYLTSHVKLDAQIATLDPAKPRQPVLNCSLNGPHWIVLRRADQHSDSPHALILLRPRSLWLSRRAAQNREEFTPPHGTANLRATPSQQG
jgi:hypothetical protein